MKDADFFRLQVNRLTLIIRGMMLGQQLMIKPSQIFWRVFIHSKSYYDGKCRDDDAIF